MHLHLIRHGQTDWNATRRIQGQAESHLDQTGEAQAVALGERLAEVPFRSAYISSAQRTRQTAERVLAARELPCHFRDDLREMRLGRWETHLWADVERDEPEQVGLYRAFDERFQIEGAERLAQMQQRGIDAIADIVATERKAGAGKQDHIAIVSHGFLLRAILADVLDRPLPDFAGAKPLPNCAHSIVVASAELGLHAVTIDSEPPEVGLWAWLFV